MMTWLERVTIMSGKVMNLFFCVNVHKIFSWRLLLFFECLLSSKTSDLRAYSLIWSSDAWKWRNLYKVKKRNILFLCIRKKKQSVIHTYIHEACIYNNGKVFSFIIFSIHNVCEHISQVETLVLKTTSIQDGWRYKKKRR